MAGAVEVLGAGWAGSAETPAAAGGGCITPCRIFRQGSVTDSITTGLLCSLPASMKMRTTHLPQRIVSRHTEENTEQTDTGMTGNVGSADGCRSLG